MPNEKQRRRPGLMPGDLQKRQRHPLHPRPYPVSRAGCCVFSSGVDRAVRPVLLSSTLVLPPTLPASPTLHPQNTTNTPHHSYLLYLSLAIFVFLRERSRAKQRKWIGAQKRASLIKRRSEDEEEAAAAAAKKEEQIEREATPMLESRASLAQENRGKTVTWE